MSLVIQASYPRPTSTGATSKLGPGVDVTIRLVFSSDRIVKGEVTLLPAEDGSPRYVAWGSLDHWLGGALIEALDAMPAVEREAARDAIETTAAHQIAAWLRRRETVRP